MSVSSPDRLSVTRRGALFTESSLLFLIWHSQWLQAKEPVGPMDVSVAHGVWWNPWLSVWPLALGGTTQSYWRGPWHWWDPWLTEWPMAVSGTTCGFWHGPRSSVWPEAVGGTCGVWHGPWLLVAPVVVSGA